MLRAGKEEQAWHGLNGISCGVAKVANYVQSVGNAILITGQYDIEGEGQGQGEQEDSCCRGSKLCSALWHLSRIKCGFCLHFYSLLWRQATKTVATLATLSTNPANLFVSTSPRLTTLGQLLFPFSLSLSLSFCQVSLVMVSECDVYLGKHTCLLLTLSLSLSPSLSLSASISNAANTVRAKYYAG